MTNKEDNNYLIQDLKDLLFFLCIKIEKTKIVKKYSEGKPSLRRSLVTTSSPDKCTMDNFSNQF